MKYDATHLIFFSPTKTTLHVVEAIGKGLATGPVNRTDLTYPLKANAPLENFSEGVAVIGTPVYAGRVPELAVERLRKNIRGNGRPAVIVVVYGNRAYEDALLELRTLAEELGFVPVAAAAFIGEHSFSTPELPVAAGHPDDGDLAKARAFGAQVQEKIEALASLDTVSSLQVPGNFPYRDGMQAGPIAPDTKEELCTLCGECVRVCPTLAIMVGESVETNKDACIRCSACIRACPTGARFWNVPKIHDINTFLHTKHEDAKAPEIFL